ncbi:MAG: PspC domain-containing protein [Chloroflexi bacterium]|nr:MAG: PspC domain-containing protein [Chloroflexota bacterium]
MSEQRERLYRSRDQKMIAGVLGGMGEHWNVDPSIMRIVYVVLTILSGVVPGIILYALMVIIVPAEPRRARE